MVNHFGYCPSLRKKVDFEVSEVIDLQTKRGTKYQVKGFYEGRLCNTFCSATTAAELRNSVGTPKNFVVMAEESQENLGQATQEENVPAIVGPSELAYGQEGEAAEALPLAETVPTPIIDADGIGIEPIDNLSLPDATVEDMQITYDEAPQMDANFEIAEMQPEGDGSSIGNIAPMNPDAPLHAEDFESEESAANLGQATQEANVPAIVGPSELAYGQEGEAAEALPLAETVPRQIIGSNDMGLEPIDNLNLDLNGGDILSAMQVQYGQAPEMLADFSIAPMQPEGDGSSIGNIAPMNPDAPLHAEEFDSEDSESNYGKIVGSDGERCWECGGVIPSLDGGPYDASILCDCAIPTFGVLRADDHSSISFDEVIAMEEVPPAVCFVEKIPPEVWANMSLEEKILYEQTGDESVLTCTQCGMSKGDMRAIDGYCPTTDPDGQDYVSTNSCPYEKYFAPQHWIQEPKVIGHISERGISLEDTLPPDVDMPPIDPLESGVITTTIPAFIYNEIYSTLPSGVMAKQTPLGFNYVLSYYGMDEPQVKEIIDINEGQYDFMYASEQYTGNVVASSNGGFELQAESIVPYSAEYTVEITGFTGGEPKRITGTEQELKDELFDFQDIDSRLEMVDYYGFDEDDYEKSVKMLTEKWNEKSLATICDNDDMLTLIETKEAKGARKCTKHFWELASRKNPISGGMQFFNQCVLCGKKNFSRGGSAMSDRGWFAEEFGADDPYNVHPHLICERCGSAEDTYIGEGDYELMNTSNHLEDVEHIWCSGCGHATKLPAQFHLHNCPDNCKRLNGLLEFEGEDELGFHEWAQQEGYTHGKKESFREWADEEEEQHGDISFDDWADHEEESHVARYGAESFEAHGFGGRWKHGDMRALGSDDWGEFYIRKNHDDSYDVLLHDPDGKITDERLKPMRDSMESYWIIGKIKREIHPHFPTRHWWVIEVPVFSNDKITWIAGDKTRGRYDERMLEGHYPTLSEAIRSIEWWFYEMDGGLDMGSWVEGTWDAEEFASYDFERRMLDTLNMKYDDGDYANDIVNWWMDENDVPESVFVYVGDDVLGDEGKDRFEDCVYYNEADGSLHPDYEKYAKPFQEWFLAKGYREVPELEQKRMGYRKRERETDSMSWDDDESYLHEREADLSRVMGRYGAEEFGAETFEVIYRLQAKYSPDESWENVGDFDKREDGVNAFNRFIGSTYDLRLIEIETMYEDDAPREEADRVIMSHSSYGELGVQTFDAEWNLDVVGGKGLTTDNIIVRRNDVAKGRLAVYPRGHESVQVDVYEPEGSHIDSHFFEAPETKVKPPVKTLGILLGVGALAAYLAPQNLKGLFKK